LKSWWVSKEFGGTVSLQDGEEGYQPFSSHNSPADPDVVIILRIALENAFRQIEPYQLLFLRLVYLHGVKHDHLAKISGCHPTKIGRNAATALKKIRKLTVQYIKVLDPSIELQWEDCQAICEQHQDILHGRTTKAPANYKYFVSAIDRAC
jgi:hypothetical protein